MQGQGSINIQKHQIMNLSKRVDMTTAKSHMNERLRASSVKNLFEEMRKD